MENNIPESAELVFRVKWSLSTSSNTETAERFLDSLWGHDLNIKQTPCFVFFLCFLGVERLNQDGLETEQQLVGGPTLIFRTGLLHAALHQFTSSLISVSVLKGVIFVHLATGD